MVTMLSELNKIAESEINFTIGYFYDHIWTVKLGDDMNGYEWSDSFLTLKSALGGLIGEIMERYPDSDYATKMRKRTDWPKLLFYV